MQTVCAPFVPQAAATHAKNLPAVVFQTVAVLTCCAHWIWMRLVDTLGIVYKKLQLAHCWQADTLKHGSPAAIESGCNKGSIRLPEDSWERQKWRSAPWNYN